MNNKWKENKTQEEEEDNTTEKEDSEDIIHAMSLLQVSKVRVEIWDPSLFLLNGRSSSGPAANHSLLLIIRRFTWERVSDLSGHAERCSPARCHRFTPAFRDKTPSRSAAAVF
ncbi:unnamed protein product [Pleuronectes platessa]|uniref:Uncharacterized protein n=1 Tax=Pleuronectes platessa TaxID=8262 RepID=A0A9N7VC18_PLEPL|nr:unnamed protein product [Pleuronectes platessa]